ncbi:MAG: hypothetical protein ACKPB9_04330, partial [Dolichospermum sp.]
MGRTTGKKSSISSKIKLAFITDDTPVDEQVMAHGMCRVNTRLLRALDQYVSLAITNLYSNGYQHKHLLKEIQNKYVLMTFPYWVQKILGRFFPKLRSSEFAFQLMLPTLVKRLRHTEANWIFCSCGADPKILDKGFQLAQASNLPLAVYLVDDFLESAILSKNLDNLKMAQEKVPYWLSESQKIFVISDGLRQLLLERYKLDSVVLPLPYELPQDSLNLEVVHESNQIMFVGSLSHFYVDGVRQLAEILDEINQSLNTSITLRLTSCTIEYANQIIGKFQCLRCKPCSTMMELYQEIASSLFCFAPYSFDKKYETMVKTSFPSKTMDYLAYAKLIVLYAPDYSTSSQYFAENGLSVCVNNATELREIIITQ